MNLKLLLSVFLSITFNLYFIPAISAQSFSDFLQADYDFNEGSLLDASPNQLHATASGTAPSVGVEGLDNSALLYNGSSSYVDCGTDNRNISDQLTISIWIRSEYVFDRQKFILSKYDSANDHGYFMRISNGAAAVGGRDGSGNFFEIKSPSMRVDNGRWTHLVAVIDGNHWQLYVNCHLVNELTTGTIAPDFSSNAPLHLGQLSIGGNSLNVFEGSIDNFKIYNTALSREEISQISEYTCPEDNLSNAKAVVRHLNTADHGDPRGIVEMPDGDIMITGELEDMDYGPRQGGILVARFSPFGEIRWAKKMFTNFTSLEHHVPMGIKSTSDGNYSVISSSANAVYGGNDFVAFKINSNGNVSWFNIYGGADEDRGYGLEETADGGLLLVGSTTSFGTEGVQNGLVIKTDAAGEPQWYRSISGPGTDQIFHIQPVNDTTFLLSGMTDSGGAGGQDFMMLQMSDQGSLLSGDLYGNAADDFGLLARPTTDGGFLLYGQSLSHGLGGWDGLVIKVDAMGAVVWSRAFGGSGDDQVSDLLIDGEDHIFLSGYTENAGAGETDLFLLRLSPDGNLLEARTYGEEYHETLTFGSRNTLLEHSNGRLIILGSTVYYRTEFDDSRGILFANLSSNRDDVCLGQDWAVSFNAVTPVHNTFSPLVNSYAVQVGDQSVFVEGASVNTTSIINSDHCPPDLIITESFADCSYQASNNISTSGTVVIPDRNTFQSFSFRAGNSITLNPGFHAGPGTRFLATIEDCSVIKALRPAEPEVIESTLFEGTPENGKVESGMKIFPNPARNRLRVQLKIAADIRGSLLIQNATGRVVYDHFRGRLLEQGEIAQDINISSLPAGMYFVRLETEEQIYIQKLIKVD